MASEIKKLLGLRKKMKQRKPYFVVKESHNKVRVQKRWRSPRGIHSPHRQRYRGKPALPSPGYSSPRAIRGLSPQGLETVVVYNHADLLSIDIQKQGAIIASTLGTKKRLELLQQARDRKIPILNVKDISVTVATLMDKFNARKKSRQEKVKRKGEKEEEKKKKAEEKKKTETAQKPKELSAEEKAVQEEDDKKKRREEAEKTIIKRQ